MITCNFGLSESLQSVTGCHYQFVKPPPRIDYNIVREETRWIRSWCKRGPNTKLASSLLLGLDVSYARHRGMDMRRWDGCRGAGRRAWTGTRQLAEPKPESIGAKKKPTPRLKTMERAVGATLPARDARDWAAGPNRSLPPASRCHHPVADGDAAGNCSHVDRPPRAYKTHRDESWGVR
jgi:hypothetical protein